MNPFQPELGEVMRERERLLNLLLNTQPAAAAPIKAEFDRVHARVVELLRLQHDWMVSGLDAVIDQLEAIVREERQRISGIFPSLKRLVDRLSEEDRGATLAPTARIPGAPGPVRAPAAGTAFSGEALAALAEIEARKELVLGKDREALRYVESFRDALSGWETMPWCAAFVHWCCNQLQANLPVFVPGLPENILPGVPKPTFAYNIAWKVWAQQNNMFHPRDGFAPARGDIVAFDWTGDGRNDHVAIMVARADDAFLTAEGNTRNSKGERMSSALRRRNHSLVDGFIRLPNGFRIS